MKRPSEHKIVIDCELVQSSVKILLKDEPASFIDDDQRVHCPNLTLAYFNIISNWLVDVSTYISE